MAAAPDRACRGSSSLSQSRLPRARSRRVRSRCRTRPQAERQPLPRRPPRRPRPRQRAGHPAAPRAPAPGRGLDRALATTRSARPRAAWARLRAVPGQVRPPRPGRLRPGRRRRGLAHRAVPAVPAVPGPRHPVRAPGQGAVTAVVPADRVLAARGRVRRACRPGRSAVVPAGRVVPVERADPAARAVPRVAEVLAPVPGAVPAAVVAVAARVRPVPGWARRVPAPAAVAGPEPRVRSAGPAGVRRGAGSRRSSAARSSTTCRRRRSAACRYRAATAS